MRHWFRTMLLLLPLGLGSGCTTSALWTESAMDNWNQPAVKSNLRLFAAGPPQDFLVVYDEYSDRHQTNTARAYFLYQNLERMAQKHGPHFVSVARAKGMAPVPVFPATIGSGTDHLARPFVISSTNDAAFTLYYSDGGSDLYHLPIYNDGTGKYKRAALTPLTVTADAAIAASIVGVIWWADLAGATVSP
jgi:hypothetical protein